MRNAAISALIAAVAGLAMLNSSIAKADVEIAQSAAEREALRAAEESESDARREINKEKEEEHDAREQGKRDLILQREQRDRDAREAEAVRNRVLRKERLENLIDR